MRAATCAAAIVTLFVLAVRADNPLAGAPGGGPVRKYNGVYYQLVKTPQNFRSAMLIAAKSRSDTHMRARDASPASMGQHTRYLPPMHVSAPRPRGRAGEASR